MLWVDRSLFEYWVHIVPTSDLWLHRVSMRRYPGGPHGELKRRRYVRDWLEANEAFRRYVLRELRLRGPLRARDLEDRVADGWHTGWMERPGRNVAMMLDLLWSKGEVMIVGRDGQQRLWDLASRSLPLDGVEEPGASGGARGPGPTAQGSRRRDDSSVRLAVRRTSRRLATSARRPRARGRRGAGADRGHHEGRLVRARRAARSPMEAAHRRALAVRRSRERPRPHRGVVRLPFPDRDLRAEGDSAGGATSCCRSCAATV